MLAISPNLRYFRNAVSASIVNWSDTLITAAVPSNATSGVVVVKAGGVSSQSTLNFNIPAPQVASVTPNRGAAGTQVTIAGTGFHAAQGPGSVTFNRSPYAATVVSWSDTQIIANALNYGSTGWVSVWQNVYSNSDVLFTYINPVVTSVSPTGASVGAQVQINGSGFGATQGSSSVTFNGVAGPAVSWSDTQVVATVPPTASSGVVRVVVSNVSSLLKDFLTEDLQHFLTPGMFR